MHKQKNKRIETVIAWLCYSMTSIFAKSDCSFHHHGAAADLRDVQRRLAMLANCYREFAKKKPRITEAFPLLCGRYRSSLSCVLISCLRSPAALSLSHAALGLSGLGTVFSEAIDWSYKLPDRV